MNFILMVPMNLLKFHNCHSPHAPNQKITKGLGGQFRLGLEMDVHLKCFSCSLSHLVLRDVPLHWMVESAEPAQPHRVLVLGHWMVQGWPRRVSTGPPPQPSFLSPLHANAWSTWQLAKHFLHLLSCVILSKILEKGLGRDDYIIFSMRFREVVADEWQNLGLNSHHSTLKRIIFPLYLSPCIV